MVTNKPESKDVVLMMTVSRDRLGKKISECLNRYDEQNLVPKYLQGAFPRQLHLPIHP